MFDHTKKAPAFAAELQPYLNAAPPGPLPMSVDFMTSILPYTQLSAAQVIGTRAITHEDVQIPGLSGDPDLTLAIFRPAAKAATGPLIYFLHAGGLVMGNRFFSTESLLDWVETMGATLVSAEYRLAQHSPYPAAAHDAYAGLLWVAAHARDLGHDPAQLYVAGASAGGGLAAATVLRARDDGGPAIAGQILFYPMLDDRDDTVAHRQYEGFGRWDRETNNNAWGAYLGEARAGDAVAAYGAPARAADLGGLPPTYIDAGSAELFRDEIVTYASRIWADGGDCELHVWQGGFHAFETHVPQAQMSIDMLAARKRWLGRMIAARPAEASL